MSIKGCTQWKNECKNKSLDIANVTLSSSINRLTNVLNMP